MYSRYIIGRFGKQTPGNGNFHLKVGGVYIPSQKSIHRKCSETQLEDRTTFNLLERLGGPFLHREQEHSFPKFSETGCFARLAIMVGYTKETHC